jgi:ornithine--oxo-acid transaminase
MPAPRILMCPPDHFEVAYAINPWMEGQAPVDRELAHEQWSALRATLGAAGAEVEVLPAVDGLPDLVFTANAGLVDGRTFIPARMRHPERVPEAEHTSAWFRERGFAVRELPASVVHEGAGDALRFASTLVGGHRTRSTAGAYVELARAIRAQVLPVELVDPRLYHVDLVFCPLDDRHAIVAPVGLDAEGLRLVRELVPEPLELTEEEALSFCANSVVVGRTVVMPACPPRVEARLRAWGFEPVVVDVSEFLKAGGGPKCLTLRLDEDLSGALPVDGGLEATAQADARLAHNYHPLPVTVARADGAWVQDAGGRWYLDALSAYSALNFGHRHPALVRAAEDQLHRVTLTSRAFGATRLGPYAARLADLCGKDRVLLMNTGAEAVETAIKAARKWGYEVKGVPAGQAKVVVCSGNFHGRTTTIVSFSDDPQARDGFGPFTPGFVQVPYGDLAALDRALADPHVVAFLVEPVQGEAGVVVPPVGFLRGAADLCAARDVLLVADEIQSGLGRTGRTFACDHEGVRPDVVVLGKALGGGIVPLSGIAADDRVLGVFRPGDHGSTFGGNPLACAVGDAVLDLLAPGDLQDRAAAEGARLLARLRTEAPAVVQEVRGIGLWFGVQLRDGAPPARAVCEGLLARGVLAKDTHEHTIRLAPPLVTASADLDRMADALLAELHVAAGASRTPLAA